MAISFRSKFGATNIETEKGLNDTFKNTPLEKYLPLVMRFFCKEVNSWEEPLYKEIRSDLCHKCDEALQLGKLLLNLKSINSRGNGVHIDSTLDRLKIYDFVESMFFEKIDSISDVFIVKELQDFSTDSLYKWEKALSILPRRDSFLLEEKEIDENGNEVDNGHRRLSLNEINHALMSIKQGKASAQKFFLESDIAVANRFVSYMIINGVPENRAMYRCFFKALDCFGLIPRYIKESHKTHCADLDPEGNYIKAIASRIHEKIDQHP